MYETCQVHAPIPCKVVGDDGLHDNDLPDWLVIGSATGTDQEDAQRAEDG
jgi:hypothetical protein